jgi:hypothetical protein
MEYPAFRTAAASIVPVRQVAGSMRGDDSAPGTANPPADKTSFWTGSYLNINAVNLAERWGTSTRSQLVRPDTGAVISCDSAGNSSNTSPGWYFTTADDYAARSAQRQCDELRAGRGSGVARQPAAEVPLRLEHAPDRLLLRQSQQLGGPSANRRLGLLLIHGALR